MLVVKPGDFDTHGFTGEMKRRISLKNTVLKVIEEIRFERKKPKLTDILKNRFGEYQSLSKLQNENKIKIGKFIKKLYTRSMTQVRKKQDGRFRKISMLMEMLESQVKYERMKIENFIY